MQQPGSQGHQADRSTIDGTPIPPEGSDTAYFSPLVSIPELHLEGYEIGDRIGDTRARTRLALAVALVALCGGLFIYHQHERFGLERTPATWTGFSLVALSLLFPFIISYRATAHRGRPQASTNKSEEGEDLSRYEGIVNSNQRLIIQYHAMTTRQAASAYRNTQFAMAACLAVLLFGGVMIVQLQDGITRIVVGALAALGTGLSAYLGATFISTYNRTLNQLNFFFGQPLVNSYLLAAERLSGKLSAEAHDRAVSKIVDQLLKNAATNSDILLGLGGRTTARKKRAQAPATVDKAV